MKALVPLLCTFLLGWSFALSPAARACEKHLDGHQNGSETQGEAQQR